MSKHKPVQTGRHLGGAFKRFQFDNGYGASVVSHPFSYGGKTGLWEIGVLGVDGRLTYDTPITNDVIGFLEWEQVEKVLDDIAALPVALEVAK